MIGLISSEVHKVHEITKPLINTSLHLFVLEIMKGWL